MTNIFISKNESEIKDLTNWCNQHGIKLYAQSLIRIECREKQTLPKHDWIFFGSKNAVKCYFEKYSISSNTKVACIGKSTAKALEIKGVHIDFIGENASDPFEVAQNLKEKIGDKKMLYLISSMSKRSISKVIPADQLVEFILYETIEEQKRIPEKNDYVIFTSPSNVNSFFKLNTIDATQKVISWGKTCTKELEKNQIEPYYELQTAQLDELIDFIEKDYV
jgi:uroporphyrinogen-III synthase